MRFPERRLLSLEEIGTMENRSPREHDSGRSIGDILAHQPPLPFLTPHMLTERISSPAEAAQWSALIATTMSSGPRPRDAYSRVMASLHYLARHGTCLHPLSPTRWRRLEGLAALCGHRGDWQSRSGPVIGASNATLETHLGITNVRRELRDLAAWGLIIPHQLKGNGHRYYGRRHLDGMVDASGWALAPLVVLVEELEHLVERDKQLRLLFVTLPKQITAVLRSARNLIPEEAPDALAEHRTKIAELAAMRDSARGHSVEALRSALAEATNLLFEIQSTLAALDTDLVAKLSSKVDAPDHPTYNETKPESVRNGSAEGRSGNGGDPLPASRRVEPSSLNDETDRFGIQRSGFEWTEAETLFPAIAGLTQIARSPTADDIALLGNILQINPQLCWRATRILGAPATALCLMITAQHLADGHIIKTPAAYFNGLVSRARADDLNLGHTIFGRRQAGPRPKGATN